MQSKILSRGSRVVRRRRTLRDTVKMHYTYLLESQKDSGWYIGYTNNLKIRFLKHSQGKVTSTKNRRPVKLIYYEAYLNRIDAQKRERFLKSGSGRKFLKNQLKNYLKKLV